MREKSTSSQLTEAVLLAAAGFTPLLPGIYAPAALLLLFVLWWIRRPPRREVIVGSLLLAAAQSLTILAGVLLALIIA